MICLHLRCGSHGLLLEEFSLRFYCQQFLPLLARVLLLQSLRLCDYLRLCCSQLQRSGLPVMERKASKADELANTTGVLNVNGHILRMHNVCGCVVSGRIAAPSTREKQPNFVDAFDRILVSCSMTPGSRGWATPAATWRTRSTRRAISLPMCFTSCLPGFDHAAQAVGLGDAVQERQNGRARLPQRRTQQNGCALAVYSAFGV